jgi:hypothetical protein
VEVDEVDDPREDEGVDEVCVGFGIDDGCEKLVGVNIVDVAMVFGEELEGRLLLIWLLARVLVLQAVL